MTNGRGNQPDSEAMLRPSDIEMPVTAHQISNGNYSSVVRSNLFHPHETRLLTSSNMLLESQYCFLLLI